MHKRTGKESGNVKAPDAFTYAMPIQKNTGLSFELKNHDATASEMLVIVCESEHGEGINLGME